VEALKQMAAVAVEGHLRGSSWKRNSLLKPLDIILDNLESEPKEEFRDLVRRASERNIFDHIDSIADPQYKPGKRKQDQIRAYVDIFFDDILVTLYKKDVNRLLRHNRMLRSAYLIYYRDALPEKIKEHADTEQSEETQQHLEDGE
jgi:CRISPR-associated protein Csc3